MAGLYPDVPAPRMAYDLDGTVGFYASSDGTTVSTFTAPQLAAMNDESPGDALPGVVAANQYYVGLIFPEFRDIVAFTIAGTSAQSRDFQVSTDTTTGVDGTWTTVDAGFFPVGSTGTYLRTGIITLAAVATGVKGIRLGQAAGVDVLHVYGVMSTGQTLDRLRFWDPVSDVSLDLTPAFFDFGEVVRGGSSSATFRIKNDSGVFTANGVTLVVDVPTDPSPSLLTQLFLNTGSGNATSVNLGNLAPGVISAVVTLNRSTDALAQLGLWTGRITAAATSWT